MKIHKVVLTSCDGKLTFHEWVVQKTGYVLGRDRTGRINRKSLGIWVLHCRCNNTDCPGTMIIPMEDVNVALELRTRR